MSELRFAMPTIFLHEGKFVDNTNDPGGATNFGISLRFLKQIDPLLADLNHDGIVDSKDIKIMTKDEATQYYDKYFWSKFGYSNIAHQELATRVMDISINIGPVNCHKCLQRAITKTRGLFVKDDGILGPLTFTAINATNKVLLITNFKAEVESHYKSLVDTNPKLSVFLKGWINRVNSQVVII